MKKYKYFEKLENLRLSKDQKDLLIFKNHYIYLKILKKMKRINFLKKL